jgi:hypothetical protein
VTLHHSKPYALKQIYANKRKKKKKKKTKNINKLRTFIRKKICQTNSLRRYLIKINKINHLYKKKTFSIGKIEVHVDAFLVFSKLLFGRSSQDPMDPVHLVEFVGTGKKWIQH